MMNHNHVVNCYECGHHNKLECFSCNMQANVDCACLLTTTDMYVAYQCHDCMKITEVDVEAYCMDDEDNFLLCYDSLEEYSNYVDATSYMEVDVDDTDDDIIDVYLDEESKYDWTYYEDKGQAMRSRISTWSKCRHYNHPLEFPDGTMVYPSSHTDRDESEARPDFGLYLDHCWQPTGIAGFIAWPDFGAPTHPVAAAMSIIDAFKKAADGLWVEVGCIGGHGRTGTVLACMAILSGVKADKAVKWVRKNYCDHAVEAPIQEWFIEFFDAFLNGGSTQAPDESVYAGKGKPRETVPGKNYVFPEGRQINWRKIDFIRDIATGTPPADLLTKDKTLKVKTNSHEIKEKIRIVKSNGNADAAELPF